MKKYIDCKFNYIDSDGELVILTYTGKTNEHIKGLCCNICNKEIKTCAHTFNDENGAEWIFGSECVKKVFNKN